MMMFLSLFRPHKHHYFGVRHRSLSNSSTVVGLSQATYAVTVLVVCGITSVTFPVILALLFFAMPLGAQ